MRYPEDLLSRQGTCSTLSGCPSSAWPLQHVAFSPSELFDFLHRQLQTKNPYCRPRRYRWTACKAAIGNLLKSGALLSIIEQLDAQQGPAPPKRIEDKEALAPKPKRGRPPLPMPSLLKYGLKLLKVCRHRPPFVCCRQRTVPLSYVCCRQRTVTLSYVCCRQRTPHCTRAAALHPRRPDPDADATLLPCRPGRWPRSRPCGGGPSGPKPKLGGSRTRPTTSATCSAPGA